MSGIDPSAASIADFAASELAAAARIADQAYALAAAGQTAGADVMALTERARALSATDALRRFEADAAGLRGAIEGRIGRLAALDAQCAPLLGTLEAALHEARTTLDAWRRGAVRVDTELERQLAVTALEGRIATLAGALPSLQRSAILVGRLSAAENHARDELALVDAVIASLAVRTSNLAGLAGAGAAAAAMAGAIDAEMQSMLRAAATSRARG